MLTSGARMHITASINQQFNSTLKRNILSMLFLNPFPPEVAFPDLVKTSDNLTVFLCFQGV